MTTIYRTAPAYQNRVQQGNNSTRYYARLDRRLSTNYSTVTVRPQYSDCDGQSCSLTFVLGVFVRTKTHAAAQLVAYPCEVPYIAYRGGKEIGRGAFWCGFAVVNVVRVDNEYEVQVPLFLFVRENEEIGQTHS